MMRRHPSATRTHGFVIGGNNFLEPLFPPDARLAFLAGAGISVAQPSCLPSGIQQTENLIGQLLPNLLHEKFLALMNTDRDGMLNAYDFLRFEELVACVQKEHDPQLAFLDVYAHASTPNSTHVMLADAIRRGHMVFTTNFDNLIEHGLLRLGTSPAIIRPVIKPKDWAAQADDSCCVYKLHGSLIDIRNNEDVRDSLKATMDQITRIDLSVSNAGSHNQVFGLESYKHDVLASALANRDLVVVGYSGVDDFDIMPTLRLIPSECRIIWITHKSECHMGEAQVELASTADISGQPLDSVTPDRLGRHLLELIREGTRAPGNVFRVYVNTQDFLLWLWRKFEWPDPWTQSIRASAFVQSPVVKRSAPAVGIVPDHRKWFLAGYLFHRHQRFSDCDTAFTMAVAGARKSGDKSSLLRCLNGLAATMSNDKRKRNTIAIIRLLLEAVELADELHLPAEKASALNSMGNVYHDQGDLEKAVNFYEEAITIAREYGDLQLVAASLNNLAQAEIDMGYRIGDRKYLFLAKSKLMEAFEMDRTGGDPYNQAVRFLNIGEIDYFNSDQNLGYLDAAGRFHNIALESALKHYSLALETFWQLGALDRCLYCLVNLGATFDLHEQTKEALQYYNEAARLAVLLQSDLLHGIQLAVDRLREKRA